MTLTAIEIEDLERDLKKELGIINYEMGSEYKRLIKEKASSDNKRSKAAYKGWITRYKRCLDYMNLPQRDVTEELKYCQVSDPMLQGDRQIITDMVSDRNASYTVRIQWHPEDSRVFLSPCIHDEMLWHRVRILVCLGYFRLGIAYLERVVVDQRNG